MTEQEKMIKTFRQATNLIETIEEGKAMILEQTGYPPPYILVDAMLAQQIRVIVAIWPGFMREWTTPEPDSEHVQTASFHDLLETMNVPRIAPENVYIGRLCGTDIYECISAAELAIPHHDAIARVRIAE